MGTQRIQSALFRSNLRDSHFQTDGIATDFFDCKYTHYFIPQRKKSDFASKKTDTAFPVTKVEDLAILLQVLFGIYLFFVRQFPLKQVLIYAEIKLLAFYSQRICLSWIVLANPSNRRQLVSIQFGQFGHKFSRNRLEIHFKLGLNG